MINNNNVYCPHQALHTEASTMDSNLLALARKLTATCLDDRFCETHAFERVNEDDRVSN